jgi:hypothetical protein
MNEYSEEKTTRHELDKTYSDRLLRLESRLDSLDISVRASILMVDEQIKKNIKLIEVNIAEATVDLAVAKAFMHLGVDVNDPIDLKKFQENLRIGILFSDAAAKGFFALFIAICGAIGLSFWMVIKSHLGFKE